MDCNDFLPLAQLVPALSGERRVRVRGRRGEGGRVLRPDFTEWIVVQGKKKKKMERVTPSPSPLSWCVSCTLHYWIRSKTLFLKASNREWREGHGLRPLAIAAQTDGCEEAKTKIGSIISIWAINDV